MKKFFFLCVILICFICSCDLLLIIMADAPEEDEKIKVINETGEDVKIYGYLYGSKKSKSHNSTIYIDEERFIRVAPNIEYSAEGNTTKKDYGSRTFSRIPSYVDVVQTWVISPF